MHDVTIRLATSADTRTLVDLMQVFYAEQGYPMDRDKATRTFTMLLDDPVFGKIWLAQRQDEALGYIILTLGFSMEYGGRDSFVDDLFVIQAARGQGIGSRLLDTLFEECKRLDVKAVHLEVENVNQQAQKLYLARGFTGNDRTLLTRRFS